jgi:hypothetical protein
MKISKKLLQTNCLFSSLHAMRKKLRLAIITAAFFGGFALLPVARADEQLTPAQTALSNTTISGGDIPPLMDSSDSSDSPDLSSIVSAPSPSFSPTPAPEPSTIGLFAVGILTLIAFARSKRPNQQAGDAVTGLR